MVAETDLLPRGVQPPSHAPFPHSIVTLVAAALFAASGAGAEPPIPYPDALVAAAVSESKISDIRSLGLVVGNGELNAIVYSSADNDLHLRLSKNDCWDMRIATQDDPPLPVVDVAAGTAVGHGDASSWKKHPYPTALPVAEVVLGADGQTAVTGATLDLARAVATIKTAEESADVRVLAQSNVILIHSKRPVSFIGDQELLVDKKPRPKSVPIETWVSKADEGEQDGCRYLHQNIPGDEDASGMDLYVVAGRKGDLQAIAVTTSRDSAHPLADAVALVSSTLNDADAVNRNLPRAEWVARTSFLGAEGAFFHSDIWSFEPDPALCKTGFQRRAASHRLHRGGCGRDFPLGRRGDLGRCGGRHQLTGEGAKGSPLRLGRGGHAHALQQRRPACRAVSHRPSGPARRARAGAAEEERTCGETGCCAAVKSTTVPGAGSSRINGSEGSQDCTGSGSWQPRNAIR